MKNQLNCDLLQCSICLYAWNTLFDFKNIRKKSLHLLMYSRLIWVVLSFRLHLNWQRFVKYFSNQEILITNIIFWQSLNVQTLGSNFKDFYLGEPLGSAELRFKHTALNQMYYICISVQVALVIGGLFIHEFAYLLSVKTYQNLPAMKIDLHFGIFSDWCTSS